MIVVRRSFLASGLHQINVEDQVEAVEYRLEMADSEAEEAEDIETEHQKGFMKAFVLTEWMQETTGVIKVG